MNLLHKYNDPETVAFVTLYPRKGELYSRGTSGVAMYTKNIVSRMKRRVLVFANIYDKKRSYTEANALISRSFDTKTPLMWLQIAKELRTYTKVKHVFVQFDFAIYGSLVNTAFLLPFLLYLRLTGKTVHVVNHHIVVDVKKLSGHLGLTNTLKDKCKAVCMNTVFHLFYMLLGLVSKNVIVLEETLKTMLASVIPANKLRAIPIGVDRDLVAIDKQKARKLLGIPKDSKVLLFFGFINWFKGADFFTNTFAKETTILDKPLQAIVAGGVSPTQKDKRYYQTYYQNVLSSVEDSQSTKITGYVPQKDISLYFSASDLVVLPYRHYMTASGVLSLVFSYKKPFVISENLKEMFQSPDIKEGLRESGLTFNDFVFELQASSCKKTSSKVLQNGIQKKMELFAKLMQEKRSYTQTALLYEQMLVQDVPALSLQPATEPVVVER